MNDSRISVSIDVSQSNSPVRVMCKQGDTGRVLNISLTDGGYPYVISKDCYAVFTAVKPDGKIICNPCQIVNGVIVYTFTAQTCACLGNMTAEIRLYGDDNKLLTSASFQMFVDKTVYRDGDPVVSDSEITVLTQLISETNALNQEIRDNLESGAFIGPIGPQGPQGVPGTVSFDELTDEQKESLRGGQGPQGETGKTGVYIGTEQPDDPDVNVWIDPDGDGDVIEEIAQQAVELLQPDLSQINKDLSAEQTAREQADTSLQQEISGKLPKSPANWEPWTAEEQAAARERMGINEEFQRVFLLNEIWEEGTSLIVDVNSLSHLRIFIELSPGIVSSVDNYGLISFTDSNGKRTGKIFELGALSESNRDYDHVAYCKYDINDVPTMSRWAQVGGNPSLALRGGLVSTISEGGIIPNFLVSKIHFPQIKGGVKIAIWGR